MASHLERRERILISLRQLLCTGGLLLQLCDQLVQALGTERVVNVGACCSRFEHLRNRLQVRIGGLLVRFRGRCMACMYETTCTAPGRGGSQEESLRPAPKPLTHYWCKVRKCSQTMLRMQSAMQGADLLGWRTRGVHQ